MPRLAVTLFFLIIFISCEDQKKEYDREEIKKELTEAKKDLDKEIEELLDESRKVGNETKQEVQSAIRTLKKERKRINKLV
jgi:3-methyladenine DNA glycosylase AlkC